MSMVDFDNAVALGDPAGCWIRNEDYHNLPGVSNSRLSTFIEDPRIFEYQVLSGKYRRERKAHFDLGSVVHDFVLAGVTDTPTPGECIVMEDGTPMIVIPSDVLSKSGSRAGRVWDAFEKLHSGAIMLKQHEAETAMECARAVLAETGSLFTKGIKERAFMVHDSQFDLLTRCKLDLLIPERKAIVDIKTSARQTRLDRFVTTIENLAYHRQEYFYRRVLALLGVEIEAFIFVAVATDPPYTVDCFELSGEFFDQAKKDVDAAMTDLSERKKTDNWKSKNAGQIVTISPTGRLKFKGYVSG